MTYFFVPVQSRFFLTIMIGMIICLLLLINISFKIIELYGFLFSISSLLCPIVALLYLLSLQHCTRNEQKYTLNFCLMALYAFSMGIYLLINLPAAEYMHNNPAYQIVFENIPKKFFAATVSFALSIYFPHWLYTINTAPNVFVPWKAALLACFGGMLFFSLHFYLLFMDVNIDEYRQIYQHSFEVCAFILGLGILIYLFYNSGFKELKLRPMNKKVEVFPLYSCLVCIAIVVLLICLVCEYRLIAFWTDWNVAASGLLFPIAVIISTLIGELYGLQANLRFTAILIITQLLFDGLLMGLVELPSPDFFNINSFYNFIMPRRLFAATLAILVTFVSNSVLLEYLGHSRLAMQRSTRIVIANIAATSLLCMVNYGLLFGGIYAYENIIHLALNAWVCKVAIILISLPGVLALYQVLEKRLRKQEGIS